jgi:hypothetical protein
MRNSLHQTNISVPASSKSSSATGLAFQSLKCSLHLSISGRIWCILSGFSLSHFLYCSTGDPGSRSERIGRYGCVNPWKRDESQSVRSWVLSRLPGTLVLFSFLCGLRGLSLMADADRSRFRSVAFSVWSSWSLACSSASRRYPGAENFGHIALMWPVHLQNRHIFSRAEQSSPLPWGCDPHR